MVTYKVASLRPDYDRITCKRPFEQLLVGKRGLIGAEVGVYRGTHAREMLELLDIRKLILVDPWKYYNDYVTAESRKVNLQQSFLDCRKLLEPFRKQVEIVWIKQKSEIAAERIPDNSLDFVYINGNHEYDFVYKDIVTWVPKVKKGGFVGGHDYTKLFNGVRRAVNKYCRPRKIKFKVKQANIPTTLAKGYEDNADWAFKKGGIIEDWPFETVEEITKKEMKFITKLHNKHLNQPIWIVGSDPTLDEYPNNFLDGKISIVLHLTALKFPNATYRYFNEYDRLKYLIEQDPAILDKKNIFAWPFYNKTKEESAKLTGTDKAYYLKLTPYPPNGKVEDIYGKIGVEAMKKQVIMAKNADTSEFGGYGTCLHGCLYVAIMMGGNPIHIIGSGFKSMGNKEYFSGINAIDEKMRPGARPFLFPDRTKRMFIGTEAIIEGCKKQNIEVNWFKNYEQALYFDKKS